MRLIGFALREALARYEKGAAGFAQASAQLRAVIPPDRLLADVLAAVRDRAFVGEDPLPRSEQAFAEQVKRARTRLPAVAEGAFRLLGAIAAQHHALSQRLAALPPAHGRFAADLRAQRDALVHPGFFAETPVGIAAAPAALPRGTGAAPGEVSRAPGARPAPCGAGGRAVAPLPRAARAQPGRGAARAGACSVPMDAGGAQGVALRPGAQDAVSRCRSSAWRRPGRSCRGSAGCCRRPAHRPQRPPVSASAVSGARDCACCNRCACDGPPRTPAPGGRGGLRGLRATVNWPITAPRP